MFSKILVANRGEIALRIVRACEELGIATVAIHSTADAESRHVQAATQSVCVGPPAARESYLNIGNVVSAAVITGAQAIHPGYGFLAENSSFAEICAQTRIKFIGPSADTIDLMGNKASARRRMQEAGVATLPGTPGPVRDEREALEAAQAIGYPVIVKASAGGGGKGMRVVRDAGELATQLATARAEAEAAFGNPEVYLEKFLAEPRHVEVQILADEQGNIVHLGERDCSVQTARHQKMIEEAPCGFISAATRREIGAAAVRGARAAGYRNAGTMEFLVEPGGEFYFMEMNTRIQVEHPVTEEVTGIDLVAAQIAVADGQPLPWRQDEIGLDGHSIEVRITAEDPARGFAPAAGKITTFNPPGGRGIRVDSHVYSGYQMPPFYDSLLAKIIATAPTRAAAIAKMERALRETRLEGVANTREYALRILAHPRFRSGDIATNFLERHMSESA